MDPNSRGLAFLDYYKRYILEGFKKEVPKPKCLNMICAIKQKLIDPSEFLEKIYLAYEKHAVADQQASENVLMVNVGIPGQSTQISEKELQCLDWALGTNPSQLVSIAFTVYYSWKTRKLKQFAMFLDAVQGNQKERQGIEKKKVGETH